MKLETPEIEIERSGDFQTREYTVQMNAQLFKMLSNGMYSNKVLAVVRELSCNAYDSHVSAGKADVPFEIHLPNRFDDTFWIRDYGTSMTDDEICKLYTTYFSSNRRDSNDFVGGLGLGSKSPFALTEMFNVDAYLNGTVRTYTNYMGENGVPQFSLLSEEPTDEPNGIRVSFHLNKDLVHEFGQTVKSFFKFWPVKPIVKGQNIEFDSIDEFIKGDDWSIIESTQSKRYAVMGNVCYPLVMPRNPNLSKDIVFYFNIGELEVTGSRESLSYTEKTNNAIKNKVDKFYNGVQAILQEDLDKCDSELDARIKCGDTIYLYFSTQWKYRGKNIHKDVKLSPFYCINKTIRDKLILRNVSNNTYDFANYAKIPIFLVNCRSNKTYGPKIRQYLIDKQLGTRFILVFHNDMEHVVTSTELQALKDILLQDVIECDKLPKVRHEKREAVPKQPLAIQCYEFNWFTKYRSYGNYSNRYKISDAWSSYYGETKSIEWYFIVQEYQIIHRGKTISPKYVSELARKNFPFLTDLKVYGIIESKLKKLPKTAYNMMDLIELTIANYVGNNLDGIANALAHDIGLFTDMFKSHVPTLKEVLNLTNIPTYTQFDANIPTIISILNLDIKLPATNTAGTNITAFSKQYPLLNYLPSSTPKTVVVDYIKEKTV